VRITASSSGGSGFQDLSVLARRTGVNREIGFVRDGDASASSSNMSAWWIKADGSALQPIAAANDVYVGFSWAGDGSRVVFGLTTSLARQGTFVKVFGDSSDLRISSSVPGYPQWSPDAARIACTFGVNSTKTIFTMNADGSGLLGVVPHGHTMDWSPDSRQLAYTNAPYVATHGLGIARADGLGYREVALTGGSVFGVRWSPDGKRIAAFGAKVWIVNADGSNPVTFCPPALGCLDAKSVDWSPDGSKLVVDQVDKFWIINADGSNPVAVSTACVNCTNQGGFPRWSPDGLLIAYAMSSDPTVIGSAVWVVGSDGTNPRPLMPQTFPIRDLRWRP
jgi:Tol biopolymer transport system component